MKPHFALTLTASVFAATMAASDSLTDSLVSSFRADGYSYIEIDRGRTQIKLEAVRGTQKVEIIVDRETGEELKREVEGADDDDVGRTGLRVRDRNRDFLDDDDRRTGRDDDDDDRRSGRDDDDDDDDDRRSGRDDDDDDDDDRRSDRDDDDDDDDSDDDDDDDDSDDDDDDSDDDDDDD